MPRDLLPPSRRPAAWFVPVLLLIGCWAHDAHAGPLVSNANTDKARYSPGQGVTLYVDLENSTGATFDGSVEVVISHLATVSAMLPAQAVSALGPGASTTKIFDWTPPAIDYQGYLVAVTVKESGGGAVDSASCAIDVSSDWRRFPRYGYVARYDANLADAYHIIWQLKNHHINAVQFYDWQWKHHVPYSPNATWPDIANRTIQRSTVTDMISAAHDYNMLAFNYNLYGGAYDNYWADGSGADPTMGIYDAGGHQLSVGLPPGWATSRLYEMNNRDPGWQNYIYARESEVFANLGFDGWHIDCLGQHQAYDYNGVPFNLDDWNAAFINNAKAALGKRMLFNNVDAVGLGQVAAGADVDAIYAELWDGNANYSDFARQVDSVRAYGSKGIVFAAYLNRGLSSGVFNEVSVRLADAAIFACGASHLELGDGDKMLHTEYFPDDENVVMPPSLQATMRTYYDFLVGYENLLRDDAAPDSMAVSLVGINSSTTGSAGAVWVLARRNADHRIVHLINLLANPSTAWRDHDATYPVPPTLTNVVVKMHVEAVPAGCVLYTATPDRNGGMAIPLSYAQGVDEGGDYLQFTVPELRYWDMIWTENCSPIDAVIGPSAGAAVGLSAPWPNPSAGTTNFEFRTSAVSRVSAEVFDLAGRRVKSLIEDHALPAGDHRMVWDHRDSRGLRVPPGIYEVRVSRAGSAAVRRFVVLE